jgi:hypothetical protein
VRSTRTAASGFDEAFAGLAHRCRRLAHRCRRLMIRKSNLFRMRAGTRCHFIPKRVGSCRATAIQVDWTPNHRDATWEIEAAEKIDRSNNAHPETRAKVRSPTQVELGRLDPSKASGNSFDSLEIRFAPSITSTMITGISNWNSARNCRQAPHGATPPRLATAIARQCR